MASALFKFLIIVGGLYLALLMALYFGQRRLVYVPNPERVIPASIGLEDVREILFTPEPGVQLIGWYLKAELGRPTILYFHGNGGNLAGRADRIQYYGQAGYGALIMSYRSYSGSTGAPAEDKNISDAVHVYDWLLGQGVTSGQVVLYGESLGTGVATQVATKRKAAGLILDAPYTSLVDVAQYAYPYVPVSPFMKDRYQSDEHIDDIGIPLLILHGARDAVIPVSFGQSLYEVARQPKKIVVFPQGNHTDLYDHGAMGTIRAFVNSLKTN